MKNDPQSDITTADRKPPGRGAGLAMLILAAAIAALTLYTVDRYTRERISNNQMAHELQILSEVLPANGYDNQPQLDVYMAENRQLLGSAQPLPVYRARLNSVPVALVLTVIAPDGYVAPIRLLVAIDTQGKIIGLQTLKHQETPGLGDRIDADKSDWLAQFIELVAAPDKTGAQNAKLRRDGGMIDHISGATITSRAVSNAAANALIYFEENREQLFESNGAAQSDNPEPAATR
jgi:electron transport complex protein RnfG